MRSAPLPILPALFLALAASAAPAEEPAVEDPGTVLENARVLPVSGPPLARGAVLLRGGKIVAVGETVDAPAAARRVDLSGRVLCPGFVDAASRLGLEGTDRNASGSPEAPAADAVDLRHPAFADALRAGVTSLLLAPGSGRGVFSGRTCLVKSRPRAGDLAVVADRDGPVKVSLGDRSAVSSLDRAAAAAAIAERFRRAVEADEAVRKYARDLEEYLEKAAAYAAAGDASEEGLLPERVLERLRRLDPEAREASRKELRRRLGLKDPPKPPEIPKRPREPRPSESDLLLQACARGEVAVRFEAHAVEDLRSAAALARRYGLRASVEGGAEAAAAADVLAAGRIPVALWPLLDPAPEGAVDGARLPAVLAAAGVVSAPATGDAGPGAVRHLAMAAALSAGHGLDGDAALRSLTLDAARAAGFEGRLGSLEPGKDADLLVLDGDPLALGTRVVGVWIDGIEVPLPAEDEAR